MFFEPRPKDIKADLYDRVEEYARLKALIEQKTPLILVKGLRRTGKTSLVRTCLNEEKQLYVWVDLRGLATKDKIKKTEILSRFESSINDFIKKAEGMTGKLLERLDRINGIQVAGNGITFQDKSTTEITDLYSIFTALDNWIGTKAYFTDHVILVIDEAQYFNNAADFDMKKLLASLYDNCRNILVILSGSEIGLFEKFVKNVGETDTFDGNSLSGLNKETVELPYLTLSQQEEYLKKGFHQIDPAYLKQQNFDDVLSSVIDSFGGVIGWLNNFGVKFKSKIPISTDPIEDIRQDAILVVKDEMDSLFSVCDNPKDYQKFMYSLSLHPKLGWSKITGALSDLSPDIIETIRDDLLDYGFIEKIDAFDEYYVPDPLYRHYFANKLY